MDENGALLVAMPSVCYEDVKEAHDSFALVL